MPKGDYKNMLALQKKQRYDIKLYIPTHIQRKRDQLESLADQILANKKVAKKIRSK